VLNNFYKPFKSRAIQVNHYFMVDSENATAMVMKKNIDANSQETLNFVKNND
jgi:hypothetical protein